jgi:hypothetical protein
MMKGLMENEESVKGNEDGRNDRRRKGRVS